MAKQAAKAICGNHHVFLVAARPQKRRVHAAWAGARELKAEHGLKVDFARCRTCSSTPKGLSFKKKPSSLANSDRFDVRRGDSLQWTNRSEPG